MAIWVDADACPKTIRAIIYKAAERTRVNTVFVANHYIKTPPSRVISSLQVAQGFDVADTTILERMRPGDLVITADIPLAADVLAQNGTALNPRGTLYSDDANGRESKPTGLYSRLRQQSVSPLLGTDRS